MINPGTLSLILLASFSRVAFAQSADDFWDECKNKAVAECSSILSSKGTDVPSNATPVQCGEFVDSQCKLRTFNYCTSKQGGPVGCDKYGVTPTFASFPTEIPNDSGQFSFSRPDKRSEDCIKGQCNQPQGGPVPAKANGSLAKPSKPTAATTKRSSATSNPAPAATIPKDPDAAQAEADADIAQCRGTQSTANTCCTNPAQCMRGVTPNLEGPAAGQSLTEYCKQMQSLGKTGADSNGTAAATCYNDQSACSSTCADLANKYEALANNCESCGSISIYESTLQTLLSMKSSCDQLASRVQMLNNQAMAANSSGGSGDLCQQITRAQVQSVKGPPSGDNNVNLAQSAGPSVSGSYNCDQTYGTVCQLCRQNGLSTPYCKAILEGQSAATGKVGFRAAETSHPSKSEDFNVFPSSYSDSNSRRASGNANAQASTRAIPNNTGGNAPSPGDSGFGDIANKRITAQAGVSTDILQDNTRSGGGYTYGGNNPPNISNRSPSGFRGENPVSSRFDLKKYVPNWMASLFSGSKGRSPFKNLGKVQTCLDDGRACDPNSTYPESMGFFDGDWIPPGTNGSHAKYKFIFSTLAILGTVGISWSWVKWKVVKASLARLASRLPWSTFATTKPSPQPNRRSRDIPVSDNRRKVS